jgi:hypothetical protein
VPKQTFVGKTKAAHPLLTQGNCWMLQGYSFFFLSHFHPNIEIAEESSFLLTTKLSTYTLKKEVILKANYFLGWYYNQ